MKKPILLAVVLGVCTLAFAASANGQQQESKKKKALQFTGKAAIVVVKTTAKVSWKLAKLTGKHIIVPTAKNVVVPMAKATPPVAKAAAKLAGKGIKNGVNGISKLVRRDTKDDDRDRPPQNSTETTNDN